MRTAELVTVFGVVAGVVACGGSSEPRAKSPADGPSEGAASQQADGKENRLLTHEECEQLGQSITDTCHGTNTRIATIEGWCSNVISGISAGSWVSDCEKHIKYVDAVCFASTDSVKAMMDCDSAVSK